jgi:uncharacterized protein YcfJ
MRCHMLPIVLLALTLTPLPAVAGHAQRSAGFFDQATVVEVLPIREVVRLATPRQECWTEEVEHVVRYDDGAYTVAGGILGGVIGQQFGRGTGRHVATAAGTVLGAVIGHGIGRDRTYTTMERRCRTIDDYREAERIVAYRVSYEYQGRTYTTDMDHHPGRYVRVRVSVDAVE